MIKISPSILSSDFSNLEKEIKAIQEAGADMIHIDVMDAHFVPNLTFGPPVIKAIRKHTKLPFDVHLMIDAPEKWLKDYADAGADIITFHPEASKDMESTIKRIKDLGVMAGVSLLPSSQAKILEPVLTDIDLILVMTVNPGFGGQKFMSNQLDKISTLSRMVATHDILLAVDGGINDSTGKQCINAGANMLISGSYIFNGDYSKRIKILKTLDPTINS